MASTINASNSGSGGIVQTADASGVLQLQSAGTTAVTIDTSQNVGIGTTSTTFTYTGSSTTFAKQAISTSGYDCLNLISTGAVPTLDFSQPNSASTIFRYAAIGGTLTTTTAGSENGALTFSTTNAGANVAERMRLNSDGNLLVNFTSYTGNQAGAPGKIGIKFGSGEYGLRIFNSTGGAANPVQFANSTGGEVGTINTTNTNTSYNTSSDYRLKNTIAPMTGALSKVVALKPVTYKWNLDDSEGEGFIAHELAEVCPHAVTGVKDAVDADGNPQYQGIDTSYLVATLTAAIQELKAINDTQAETINALTARVVALESKVGV